jgi:NIPSNAP
MPPDQFTYVDHRVYTIALRKMPEFLGIFERMALPVLVETLGKPLGMYTTFVGPLNQFVHQWGYVSLADYEERCRKRDAHPDFKPYLAATEKLIVSQENRLIRRVAFASLAS